MINQFITEHEDESVESAQESVQDHCSNWREFTLLVKDDGYGKLEVRDDVTGMKRFRVGSHKLKLKPC